MKPTTSIIVTLKSGDPMTIHLGDLFTLSSDLSVINADIPHYYTSLILLATAIGPNNVKNKNCKIYFTVIGVDKARYTIPRSTESGIILLSSHGKEVELSENDLIKSVQSFKSGSTCLLNSLKLYTYIAVTTLANIKDMRLHQLKTRIMDLSKWPSKSLIIWAVHHLGIPQDNIPTEEAINEDNSKGSMIDSMVKFNTIHHTLKSHNAPKHSNTKRSVKDALSELEYMTYQAWFDNSVNTTHRSGYIRGIPFINLHRSEISDGYTVIQLDSDLSTRYVGDYVVVCKDAKPIWILIADNDNDAYATIRWRFSDGSITATRVKEATIPNLVWLERHVHSGYSVVTSEEPPLADAETEPVVVNTISSEPDVPIQDGYRLHDTRIPSEQTLPEPDLRHQIERVYTSYASAEPPGSIDPNDIRNHVGLVEFRDWKEKVEEEEIEEEYSEEEDW